MRETPPECAGKDGTPGGVNFYSRALPESAVTVMANTAADCAMASVTVCVWPV